MWHLKKVGTAKQNGPASRERYLRAVSLPANAAQFTVSPAFQAEIQTSRSFLISFIFIQKQGYKSKILCMKL